MYPSNYDSMHQRSLGKEKELRIIVLKRQHLLKRIEHNNKLLKQKMKEIQEKNQQQLKPDTVPHGGATSSTEQSDCV